MHKQKQSNENTTEILFIHKFVHKFITVKNNSKYKVFFFFFFFKLLLLTGHEVFFFNTLIQGGLGHIVVVNFYTTQV